MKTFIISMSLVEVVAAYIVQRSPVNKMETEKTAIAENEADKGQTNETWQSKRVSTMGVTGGRP